MHPNFDDTKMSIVVGVPPMVQSAKALAFDVTSPAKVAEWRKYNGSVSRKARQESGLLTQILCHICWFKTSYNAMNFSPFVIPALLGKNYSVHKRVIKKCHADEAINNRLKDAAQCT